MELSPLALRQAEEHALEKKSTETLEQAEAVYLKVFKYIRSTKNAYLVVAVTKNHRTL